MVYGTPNSRYLEQTHEGGGWENKVSVSSLKQLKEQLDNLSTVLSFDDNSYGIENANSGIQYKFYSTESNIDSYASYLATDPNEILSHHGWGNYQYSAVNGVPDSNTLGIDINFQSNESIYQVLGAYKDNIEENTFLTFNLVNANLNLSNGFDLYRYQNYDVDSNPEYVLSLDNEFWKDVNNKFEQINDQKELAKSLNFEISGLPENGIDFSNIKTAEDPATAISDIIENLKFSVKTDQSWDLPLYSNTYATIHFNNESFENGGYGQSSLSFNLSAHDSDFGMHNSQDQDAIKTSELDSSTVFEFGIAHKAQLSQILEQVQENYNFNENLNTEFKFNGLHLNFNNLIDGSTYHQYISTDNDAFDISGDLSFKVSPYHDYITDFSDEGLIQLKTKGDLDSIIDVWALGDDGPQVGLENGENGISRFRNSSINLQYNSEDNNSSGWMNINAQSEGLLSDIFNINTNFSENYSDITNFSLESINFYGNEWNIRTSVDDGNYYNNHLQVRYNVDSEGVITAINNGSESDVDIPNILEIIPNIDSLKYLSLSGLNDTSYADQLQASIEMGFDGIPLSWNSEPIIDPPPPGASIHLSYNLYQQDEFLNYDADAINQLAVLGDSVNQDSRYILDINAQSLEDGFNIESTDITIAFDPQLFGSINASDVKIGGELPLANAVYIDNEAGTIRLAASSLSDLGQGSGISGSDALASISLNFDESQIQHLEKNSDGSLKISPLTFDISVNEQETVFSNTFTDETGFLNREILTLDDLGGGFAVDGQEVTLYEAQINLEQQGDGLVLGTERVIGSDAAFTNLVRKGDTITTSTDWLNVGNIEASDLTYSEIYNENASIAIGSASFSKSNIASGSFIEGEFVKDARESTTFTADIEITGEAGNVVDLSDGIVSVHAQGTSDVFTNEGLGSSNLITYQGDLNYDGRVSMKDLAFLNAGAARQQDAATGDIAGDSNADGIVDASVARDVDADFSGKIDIADLAILDSDWGKTLHTGDEKFQGSSDVSWTALDSQGNGTSWNNDSFKDQNSIEAEIDYVGSLESPASTGVIGADGNQSANDGDIQGSEFQDPLAA